MLISSGGMMTESGEGQCFHGCGGWDEDEEVQIVEKMALLIFDYNWIN